jgi:hypothetical protein
MCFLLSLIVALQFCVVFARAVTSFFTGGEIMKKAISFVLFLGIASVAVGDVSTRVCEADGNTPFNGRDIMVGTRLTIIVVSNVAEYWYGGVLIIEDADMANRGRLYGRDFDGYGYPGSCLPAAGVDAAVWDTYIYPGPGFELYGGSDPNVGDWFIFDYNALDIGDCNVAFYDYDVSETEPIHTLTFHHVRTRDFDGNTQVDFADFAVLAFYWQATDCNESGGWCEGTDLDIDGDVDFDDLMLFCEYWLERTE